MSHPYGRKIRIQIKEINYSSKEPIIIEIQGRPYRVAQQIVKVLIDRNYCLVGDIIFWGMAYRREGRETILSTKKMVINFEDNGVKDNGVHASSG